MKKGFCFRTISVIILLVILWVSNRLNLPYHDLTGYVLIVLGVLVGFWGSHLDHQNKK